ncbi:MAG: protein kinase [Rhodothermia bacterium]|nr:protein kinase [Rhodothermia bacterium]
MIGETVAHYRITEKLGSGGMGDVYRAEDTELGRPVALKFLPRELTLDESARQRFKHEAQAASALDHPHVGTIYQILEADGRSFIAMACYDGGSLKERIAEGSLTVDQAVEVAAQIARGLGKAHEKGIVHRDVKPANVMFADDDCVKIVDFGLAKLAGQTVLTKSGTTLGTIAYMSPEQARGEGVDHRADLWALGVILYEMVVGERPFKGDYDQAVVYSILNTEPEPVITHRPDAPAGVGTIVDRALQKNPDSRYQTADEMLADLVRLQEGVAVDSVAPSLSGQSLRTYRRPIIWGAVAVVACLALAYLLMQSGSTDTAPVAIAVLPMVSDSANEDLEWFSDGMTDALITDLAQVSNLRVISRNSVMRYRGTDKSAGEIAQELNVAYVVDGSVNKSGDQVRISTRLVDAAADQYVWADRYETDFTDVLDTQGRIAAAIAMEVNGKLTPADEARLGRTRTINPRVYEAYLRGMNRIAKFTPDDIAKGLEYLHQAVELDPADPLAWVGLAEGYITVGHSPAPTPDVWQRARAAAQRAITLDSTMARARSARAVIADYADWDWQTAEREFLLANQLNPNLAFNHYHYAWYHLLFGRLDEAVREHEIAIELNPLDPPMTAWMGDIYRGTGALGKAEEQVRKALELGDRSGISQLVLGWIRLDQGLNDEAVAAHEEMVQVNPLWTGLLGATYATVGRNEDAIRIATQLEDNGVNSMVAFQLAALYARLGDADRAFEWANHEPHHAFVPWLATEWSPFWALRGHPDFAKFRERLNLPPLESLKSSEPASPIASLAAAPY